MKGKYNFATRYKFGIKKSMLLYRVKGLEFDYVIIVGVNDGVIPLITLLDVATDTVNKKELFDAERSLLYVSITRAKKEVYISSSGKASILLSDLIKSIL